MRTEGMKDKQVIEGQAPRGRSRGLSAKAEVFGVIEDVALKNR